MNGHPRSECIVEFCQQESTYLEVQAAGMTARNGVVQLGPIVSGQYVVNVHPVDQSWYWIAPGSTRILPATETALTLDVPLSRRTVELLATKTHAVWAQTRFGIKPDVGLPLPMLLITTDELGRTDLALPSGRYTITHLRDEHGGNLGARSSFQWPVPDAESNKIYCED
jgi:hypothetical protein